MRVPSVAGFGLVVFAAITGITASNVKVDKRWDTVTVATTVTYIPANCLPQLPTITAAPPPATSGLTLLLPLASTANPGAIGIPPQVTSAAEMKVSPVIKAQYLPKAKRAFTTMKQVKATATAASPAPTSSVDRQLQVRSSEEHMRDLQVQEQPAVDSQMQDQLTIDAPAQEQPFIDSPASVWHEFFILFALGTGIGTGMALVYVTFKVLEASWEWSDLENSISRLWAEWDEVRYEEVDHLVPYVGAFQHPRHITDAWWGRDIGYVGHVRQRGSMGSKGEWEV